MTALLTVFWTTLFTVLLSLQPMKADEDGIECMEFCIVTSPTCAKAAECIMGCVSDEEDDDDD